MTTPAQLSAQVTEVLTRWNQQQDQLADWLTGDPAGGPNGDGTYPLTDAEGNTENFLCLPGILDQVSGPAASASNARTAAEAAQVLAEAAKAAADVAAAAAAADRTQVSQLKTDVITQRDDVAAKWSDVNFWHGQVSASQIAIVAAETATLTYRDETLTARDDTLVARNEAQVARDEAEGFAASINPATLVTTTALQAELDALVGAAPGTLDTLNEIAAALGDDPNFATTMTTSLAGKSNIGHGHVIADVSGLQTALDGKQAAGSYSLTGHNHTWAEITGKPSTFAPSAHTHIIGDVSGLQTALDGKQPVGTYAQQAHSHVISEVSGLQSALDGKLALSGGVITGGLDVHGKARFVGDGHTGTALHLSRNTGFENNDDDVAFQVFDDGLYVTIDNDNDSDSGTFAVRYVAGGSPQELLRADPSAFRYKGQNVFHDGHLPEISEVSGLQTALDGKAAASHTHTYNNIDGLTLNGWGGPRITTGSGYIDFGPANTSFAHIYTDRPAFYFNKDLQVNGELVFHNGFHPNADKLTTARTINGVPFDGTANITIADNTKAPLANPSFSGVATATSRLEAPVLYSGSGSGRLYFGGASGRSYIAPRNAADNNWEWGKEFGFEHATDRWYFDSPVYFSGGIVSAATSSRDKLRVYSSSAYAIGMQSNHNFGGIANQWAMTFQMDGTTNRGFWWGDVGHSQSQGAMSLTTEGKLTVADSIRVGYGESDTSAALSGYDLDVNGAITANGFRVSGFDSAHQVIPAPAGGSFRANSNATGAIQVTMPTTGGADMVSFWVDIFDYIADQTISVYCAGYVYQGVGQNLWVNETAMVLGAKEGMDYTVRFGHDGTNACVWIGETNKVWQYPQVMVRDVQAGHSATDPSGWTTGWDVKLATSFAGVEATRTNTFPVASKAKALITNPTLSGNVTASNILSSSFRVAGITDNQTSGVPWYGMGVKTGSVVSFGGYYGFNFNAANNNMPFTFNGGGILRHNSSARAGGNITVSTSAPSGGSNGDIWLQV